MPKQWNPLQDLVLLQDRMNRLFEDATTRRARVDADAEDNIETTEWYPNADVYDTDDEYVIAMDLPGIDRSKLDISIDKDKLTVRGSRAISEGSASLGERPAGRFARTFSMRSSINQEKIQASYKDGVLKIILPKLKEQKSKRIEIKVS